MISLPVAARSLHRQRVRLRDSVLEGASLFPFFDREGWVWILMLVWPESPQIVMLEHGSDPAGRQVDQVRARLWGKVELGVDFAALRDFDAGAVEANRKRLADLWHFDPWWVLREERFAGHTAVPVLKATNCADGFSKPVSGCYFSRDLLRVVGVISNHEFVRYSPGLLLEKPTAAPPSPSRAAANWTLDPFWLRNGWRLPPS